MINPLQITNKPRCTAEVKNAWFHRPQFSGETHECPFPIWKDGFCKRHHPTNARETLLRRRARAVKTVEDVDRRLSLLPSLPDLSAPENPS